MAAQRFYGFKQSPPDRRDLVADPAGLTVLDEVDHRLGPMPAVFDQGQLGSCTANAVGACLQYDRSLDLAPRKSRRFSRLDIYFQERKLEGTINEDAGAYGRDGFKAAQQTGVLLERAWPYDISQFAVTPPSGKRRHKLTKPYAAVTQDVDHIKAVLSNNQLVAFGFAVYDSFESAQVASNGVVPMPSAADRTAGSIGGHEVVAVGYLADYPDHVLCRNSWGTSWGIDGYFLMPWAYITSGLASDLRTIVRSAA